MYLLPFFGLGAAAKLHRWTHPDPFVNRLETGFFLGQQLLYIAWTMRLLRREPVVRLWQQPALRPGLGYIRLLAYSYAGVWVLRLLGEVAGRTNPLEKISTSLVAVLVYLLAYQLLKNAKSFFPAANAPVAKATPAGMGGELAGKLDGLMRAEKPFRDGELSLPGLAERLAVSPHQLSETLNQTIGKNFNEYVNDFRVEEAKALLVHPAYRHYSILAVAYEAGFPSKSVFYKVFKDKTGQSPSAYIKAQGKTVEG